MTEEPSPGLLERLGTLWREFLPARSNNLPLADEVTPDLGGEAALERVRAQMLACLEGKGGEVSARARAAELGRVYLGLDDVGRDRFLTLLAEDFDVVPMAVDAAIARRQAAATPEARHRAERALRRALEPPRVRLLTQFNALPNGIKFLVDLRAELLVRGRDRPALRALEADLKDLLTHWFDVGFLELRRLTWDSPAAVLEKLIAYEAVHAIRGWADLKNRLDSDRRLYAFFHPRMPDEPLIFVQVALIDGMADDIADLLDETAPVDDPQRADTAIFYSISNAQKGLAGISFGNFLIKKVVETLAAEFPRLKTFATLSPVPGFRAWLDRRLAEGEPQLLLPAEHKALSALARNRTDLPDGAKGSLKEILATDGWWYDPALADAVRAPLTRLCARYLALEKRPAPGAASGGEAESGEGRAVPPTALDPVAHFHLSNGARIERLNWLGDTSDKGMAQSAGLMVNYLYKLADIDRNHETYSEQGKAALSSAVRALLVRD